MITLVIGASCSGKSEYAEQCLDFAEGEKIYIATMIAGDEESRERVRKHRRRRRGRRFRTVESPTDLKSAASKLSPDCSVLLEGIGTLAANELFSTDICGYNEPDTTSPDDGISGMEGISVKSFREARQRILEGIKQLAAVSDELVIVSDEVNRAGCDYEGDTGLYLKLVGELNQELCVIANRVVEMVCGCAVVKKM